MYIILYAPVFLQMANSQNGFISKVLSWYKISLKLVPPLIRSWRSYLKDGMQLHESIES